MKFLIFVVVVSMFFGACSNNPVNGNYSDKPLTMTVKLDLDTNKKFASTFWIRPDSISLFPDSYISMDSVSVIFMNRIVSDISYAYVENKKLINKHIIVRSDNDTIIILK